MGTSLDNLLQKLRSGDGGGGGGGPRRPADALARFVVTKLSWRGNYKRLLAITPGAIVTQYPDSLAVTNSWAYAGDHDLAGVEVGGEHAEGGVFTLHFRRDKKVGGRAGGRGSRAGGARRSLGTKEGKRCGCELEAKQSVLASLTSEPRKGKRQPIPPEKGSSGMDPAPHGSAMTRGGIWPRVHARPCRLERRWPAAPAPAPAGPQVQGCQICLPGARCAALGALRTHRGRLDARAQRAGRHRVGVSGSGRWGSRQAAPALRPLRSRTHVAEEHSGGSRPGFLCFSRAYTCWPAQSACTRLPCRLLLPRRSPDSFSGHKLKKGKWVPVTLRVTAYAMERLDPGSGGCLNDGTSFYGTSFNVHGVSTTHGTAWEAGCWGG